MKRYQILIYIFLFFGCSIFFFAIYNNNHNNQIQNEGNATSGTRISTNVNEQLAENRIFNIINNQNEILSNTINNSTIQEAELSSYSTQIKDKASGRLTNISITCSTLNNTILQPGETFSFNKIVGKPTVERGYKEATIIIDHKTEKGIGGGNCQVSSTLYNAVLAVSNLEVIERHEHGKDVTYVPEGRDAAVSYGSLDLKFRNNLTRPIRIEAATDNQTITIRLVEL